LISATTANSADLRLCNQTILTLTSLLQDSLSPMEMIRSSLRYAVVVVYHHCQAFFPFAEVVEWRCWNVMLLALDPSAAAVFAEPELALEPGLALDFCSVALELPAETY